MSHRRVPNVSILILLDYLFLSLYISCVDIIYKTVSILILLDYLFLSIEVYDLGRGYNGLNPYFIGLPILIYCILRCGKSSTSVSILILLDYLFLYCNLEMSSYQLLRRSQSLFYWITYSYSFVL